MAGTGSAALSCSPCGLAQPATPTNRHHCQLVCMTEGCHAPHAGLAVPHPHKPTWGMWNTSSCCSACLPPANAAQDTERGFVPHTRSLTCTLDATQLLYCTVSNPMDQASVLLQRSYQAAAGSDCTARTALFLTPRVVVHQVSAPEDAPADLSSNCTRMHTHSHAFMAPSPYCGRCLTNRPTDALSCHQPLLEPRHEHALGSPLAVRPPHYHSSHVSSSGDDRPGATTRGNHPTHCDGPTRPQPPDHTTPL